MSFRSIIRLCLPLALLAVTIAAQAQTDPNAVFATVNGDEIKVGDFWHRLAWFKIDPKSPLSTLPAGYLTINELITEHLVFQMARDKGVSPSQEQIEAEIKSEEAVNPSLVTDLKANGRPESDLYDDVKYQLAQYNLRTFGITITDQEVEEHYKDYPSESTTPKQYKLRVIAVDDDDAQSAVEKDLAAGKTFADVAQAHSLDVSKGQGGEFGTVPITDLSETAIKALDAVKIGQTTDWVAGSKQNSIRVKYLVEDIIPAKLTPLDDVLRKQIRKRLALSKGDVKNTVYKDLNDATISAKVVINQPGFQKIYEELIRQYKYAHPALGK